MPEYVDSGTVRLTLTPSDTQVFGGVEASTVRVSFTPFGSEVFTPFQPTLLAQVQKKWQVISVATKYETYFPNGTAKKWKVEYFGKAP